MGRCRWTRRCQPYGAAWRRPGRSGSRRPSSAQFAPPAAFRQAYHDDGALWARPGRLKTLPTVESVIVHALNPVTSAADLAQRSREGLPRMTQRHEQPVANGQLNVNNADSARDDSVSRSAYAFTDRPVQRAAVPLVGGFGRQDCARLGLERKRSARPSS